MPFTSAQRTFLDDPWVCVLSTVGPGGEPHSAPMWYVRDGGDLLIVTGLGSQKQRNLERDTRVGVVVDRRQRPYYAVMIQGRAVPDAATIAEVRSRLAGRYLPAEDVAAFLSSRRDIPGAVFRIVPETVLEYGTPPGG